MREYIDLQEFREKQEHFRTSGECKCTLSQRMVGDGCDLCNSSLALYHAYANLNDTQKENAELRAENEWLREAVKSAIKLSADGQGIIYGWDGDCGAREIFRKIKDTLYEALNAKQEGGHDPT